MPILKKINSGAVPDLQLLTSLRVRWITEIVWARKHAQMILSNAHEVTLYNFQEAGIQRAHLDGHTEPIRTVDISADDKWIVTGADDSRFGRWNIAPDGPRQCIMTNTPGPIEKIRFAPNGDVYAAVGADVWVYPFSQAEGQREPKRLPSDDQDKTAIAVSAAGEYVAIAGWGAEILVFATSNLAEPFMTLSQHTERVNNVLFSPDGTKLHSVARDGRWIVWNFRRGEVLHDALAHDEKPIDSICYSPDHRIIATGGRDNAARFWDAMTFEPLGMVADHRRPVMALGFRHDGKMFATGSGDNTLRLWGVVE